MIKISFVTCSVMMFAGVALGQEPATAVRRFADGAQGGQGGVGDKLIEGLIESSTPNADEKTRRVQRNAIKAALSDDEQECSEHLKNAMRAADAAISDGSSPKSWQTDKWRKTKYTGSAHELRRRERGLVLQDRQTPIYEVMINPRKTKDYYWVYLKCNGQGMTSYSSFQGIYKKEGNRLVGGFPYAEGGGTIVDGYFLINDDGSIISEQLTYVQHRPDGGVFTWILTNVRLVPSF